MAWFKRDRRKTRRDKREPTYLVERDAPPWEQPHPFDRRWDRRAHELVERTRYDAYPDHAQPFEGFHEPADEAMSVDIPRRVRTPRKVRLMVIVDDKEAGVLFEPGFMEHFDPANRLQQAHLAHGIREAIEDVLDDEAQSIVEYALILALIAVVAIVVLIFLGSQISGILTELGNQIG